LSDLADIVVDELNLRQFALTDPLTGGMSKRQFDRHLIREIQRTQRYGNPLSLVSIGLDHFKTVNDTYGQAAGDLALRTISNLISGTLRPVDRYCRSGRDEFEIVLPETKLGGAIVAADRLRKIIEKAKIDIQVHRLQLTASVGVSELSKDDQDPSNLFDRTDSALYRAKEAGGNRVEAAPYWDKHGSNQSTVYTPQNDYNFGRSQKERAK